MADPRPNQPGGSTKALASLTVEMGRFNAKLNAYVKAYHLNLAETVKTSAFRLEAMIKSRTPVDTGRARNSWHTVIYGGPTGYSYKDNNGKSFDGTLTDSEGTPKTDTHAVVGSALVYMLALESGWSRQAPNGMVRVSTKEFRGQMVAAIAAIPQKIRGVTGA